MSEEKFQHPKVLLDYFKRVRAEVLNFRRAMVKEHRGAYYVERTLIKINDDGTLYVSNKDHAPTKEEAAEIKAALAEMEFPRSTGATEAGVRSLIKHLDGNDEYFYPIYNRRDGKISMVQERRFAPNGEKYFVPHSYWSDGKWRQLEPDGPLPFWKPRDRKHDIVNIMVHEGAKPARFIDWMLNSRDIEAKKAREEHPWSAELANFEHWGMIGGALAPHRSDYAEITREAPMKVVYCCDNDFAGRSALREFAVHYGGSLKGLIFDTRFKESFDLADPMPEKLFYKTSKALRWRGPAMESLIVPATFATEVVPNPSGTGRPVAVLRRAFREEWYHTVSPEVFIHKDEPQNVLGEKEFNSKVRPFSDVDDTARLLRADQANKSGKMHYMPGAPSGFFGTTMHGQFINTYQPSPIKAEKGEYDPWIDFVEGLIPDESDRHEVLRWCATLIARPGVKMHYGLLLVSENQGVGKGTLGEKVLAPIVGPQNTSFPSETDIVESQFNAWIAHKRLAVVHEIYQGASSKAYNKLKSVITDRNITVNKKHMSTYEIENWLHIFACSNSLRALKLSFDDRRWLVPKVSEDTRPTIFWTQFNDWLENENGLGKIITWANEFLLDHRAVVQGERAPDTAAKRAMIEDSMSPGMMLVANLLDRWKMDNEGKPNVFCTDNQLVEYIKTMLHNGRTSDRLEKPATLRKLAQQRGWFAGEARSKRFSANGLPVRILALDERTARLDPDVLLAEGGQPLEIPM